MFGLTGGHASRLHEDAASPLATAAQSTCRMGQDAVSVNHAAGRPLELQTKPMSHSAALSTAMRSSKTSRKGGEAARQQQQHNRPASLAAVAAQLKPLAHQVCQRARQRSGVAQHDVEGEGEGVHVAGEDGLAAHKAHSLRARIGRG